jgi:integrase
MRFKEKYTLVERKTRKGKTVWHVRYYDQATGRRITVSSGHDTKTRARAFAEELTGDGGATRSPLLEDYAADFFKWDKCKWIARQHAKGRHFGEYQARTRRAHLDNYLLPEFGKKHLSELTRPAIENWLVGLDLANQTKNHIMYSLRIVLREARAEKLIRDNPLQETEPLGKNPKRRDALTLAELRLLFPAERKKLLKVWKEPRYATLFILMAATGIRSGEARALAWRHVIEGGWLHIERAVKMNGTIGTTKTGTERVIAIPKQAEETLEWWRGVSAWKEPEDLVFPGKEHDKPLHVETLTHFFPGALERAKIPVEGRNLVVHSLRHTYNTIMGAALPGEVLRRFTGHSTPEMTALYDHASLSDRVHQLEGSRKLVEAAWTR